MQIFRRIFVTALGALAFIALSNVSTHITSPVAEKQPPTAHSKRVSVYDRALDDGAPLVGRTLTPPATPVSLNTEGKTSYKWYSCDAKPDLLRSEANSCVEISRANEYTVSQREVGKYVVYSMSVGDGPELLGSQVQQRFLQLQH